MEYPKLGDLVLSQRSVGRDEPVAVAVLVATAERERSLEVGAGEILAEDPLPVPEQLCDELIEVGIRSYRLGDGHSQRV
jgi:hypothetical protein